MDDRPQRPLPADQSAARRWFRTDGYRHPTPVLPAGTLPAGRVWSAVLFLPGIDRHRTEGLVSDGRCPRPGDRERAIANGLAPVRTIAAERTIEPALLL